MLLIEKCKEKRLKLGLTIQQISDESGIPFSTVSGFFSGSVKNPGLFTVAAICKVIRFSLDSFFGIEDDEMGSAEISRIREEYKENEAELNAKIQEHSNNLLLNEATISNYQEIIRRQDLRMQEQLDRIAYQKKAIFLLRLGLAAAILYAVLLDALSPAIGFIQY